MASQEQTSLIAFVLSPCQGNCVLKAKRSEMRSWGGEEKGWQRILLVCTFSAHPNFPPSPSFSKRVVRKECAEKSKRNSLKSF
ncbi:hypothetical protein CEXT_810331 [Caerostris extrusa]|uniref:Uncharacterized protein n=1 Tax=Caerostris extrusa TaxID=172846 RepID=A0AAV4UD50_CAEEX|nr:hypothetical protein CEXT_810331 [Caerostris extrusa]